MSVLQSNQFKTYLLKVYKIFNKAESIFRALALSGYEIMQQIFPNKYGQHLKEQK